MSSGKVLVLGLLGAVLVLSLTAAQPELKNSAVKRLLSNDATTREEAQNELLTARKDLISELTSIINNDEYQLSKPDSVKRAMFILGEMRAPEAIETLLANIGFPIVLPPSANFMQRLAPLMGTHELHTVTSRPLDTRPAWQALTKIGEPCLDAIIDKLATTGNVAVMQGCIRVLIELKARDGAAALLKQAIAKEKEEKRRENLQGNLEFLLSMK